MDSQRASDLAIRLTNQTVGGWAVLSLINYGKSAAVFRAEKNSRLAALKIFDDELITRYGGAAQLARIQREISLVGQHHPNMVQILDGGLDPTTDSHFLVMEFLDGPNLKDCLKTIPASAIPLLISQLASAAHFLETLHLVHRDIKPENIVILDNFCRLVLLDFGVIRPVGESDVTDADGIQSFVGTLQYSSPEFLLRKEVDSIDGWRALTFYQIGGVLHDLIMQRPLFSNFTNPYARLVNAVQYEVPQIQNSAVPQHLVDLARACLVKDPQNRLKLVDWERFVHGSSTGTAQSPKQRFTNRVSLLQAQQNTVRPPTHDTTSLPLSNLTASTIDSLKTIIRSIRSNNSQAFPPLRTVSLVPAKPNLLKIRFCPSPTQGLIHELTVMTNVDLVDATSQAITISVAAYVGSSTSFDITYFEIFKGIYDHTSISSSFENCIYDIFDQALCANASGNAIWAYPGFRETP